MAEQDINQLLQVRRDKLAALQEAGKDPFQITKFDQTHHTDEARALYEEHEAKLLAGRAAVNTDGMDEEAAKQAVNDDYNERRAIMDAEPIHVSIAGRMMFKRVMGKASFCNIRDRKGDIQVAFPKFRAVVEALLRKLFKAPPDPLQIPQRPQRKLGNTDRPLFFQNHFRYAFRLGSLGKGIFQRRSRVAQFRPADSLRRMQVA